MSGSLLPINSTRWEVGMANAMHDFDMLAGPIERIRSAKLVAPEPSFVPFLIHEYGLGELTPYVPNHYDLIRDGIRWQRVRGTLHAVKIGLSWLSLTAAIKEARSDREFWNSFQLYLDMLPASDAPDLERIENVATLSVPLRSKLRRGVHGHDVLALIADRARADGALLDSDSGVALSPSVVRWSFGRSHELACLFTQGDGEALGNWIEPTEDTPLRWSDMNYPWALALHPWEIDADTARRRVLAGWFNGRTIHIRLRDAGGTVIGHRLTRAVAVVSQAANGPYRFGATPLRPGNTADQLYCEAMTDFGDGAGQNIASASLVIGGAPTDAARPGMLWVGPDDLVGGVDVLSRPLTIDLRRTVRERIKFLVRF